MVDNPNWSTDENRSTTPGDSNKQTNKPGTGIGGTNAGNAGPSAGSDAASSPTTSQRGSAGTDRLLTGTFHDRESAERAWNTASSRGYKSDDISLLMSDETRKKHFGNEYKGETEIGTKAMAGAGTGSVIGGAVGATAGIIAAIGTSVLIPGLGLAIAGPIAAGLAGAGAGGITGGVIGGLIGAGIPEERARIHEKDIKEGRIVMGVKPRSDEDASYFENEWRQADHKVKG